MVDIGNSKFCYYNVLVVYRKCTSSPITYDIEIKEITAGSPECNVNDADNVMKIAIKEALWQLSAKFNINASQGYQVTVRNQSCIEKCQDPTEPTFHNIKNCPTSTCCRSKYQLKGEFDNIRVDDTVEIIYSPNYNQCALIQCKCGAAHSGTYNEFCKDGCNSNNIAEGLLKSSFSPPDCYDTNEEPWVSNPEYKIDYTIGSCTFTAFFEIRDGGERQMRLTHILYPTGNCNLSTSEIYKGALKAILGFSDNINVFNITNWSEYQILMRNQPCWTKQTIQNNNSDRTILVPCAYYLCCDTYYTLKYQPAPIYGKKIISVLSIPPQVEPQCDNIYELCEYLCDYQDDILDQLLEKLSINERETTDDITLEIKPNPASKELLFISNMNIESISIFNELSELIDINSILLSRSNGILTFNTETLTNGIYFYRLKINNKIKTGKFIILK